MHEALTYLRLKNQSVRCLVCQKKCQIAEGATGDCLAKMNQKGKLFSLNYGLIQGIQIDPIEKKPFYHFHPGKIVPSFGSYGCNFHCKQCSSDWCSYGEPATSTLKAIQNGARNSETPPEDLIEEIRELGHKGIIFSYNEPVIWAEYVLDTAKLAKKSGFYTALSTNGSWTKETLDKIGPYLDAASIHIKGFSKEAYEKQGAYLGEILEMLIYAQKTFHLFLEIAYTLIPGINDSQIEIEKMTKWIAKNLGVDTPLHLFQFDPHSSPDKDFKKIPYTTTEQLFTAAETARKNGLKYVYVLAPASTYSQTDTICPKCGFLAIRRIGYQTQIIGVNEKGNCSQCNSSLNLII